MGEASINQRKWSLRGKIESVFENATERER